MKTKLFYTLLFVSFITNAQNWVDLNFPSAINASDAAIAIHPSTGETYIAYANANDGNKTYVTKYDGTIWSEVAGPINSDNSSLQHLSFHPTTNNLWVSFVKTSESRVRVYEQVNGNFTLRPVAASLNQTLLEERPKLTFNNIGWTLLSTSSYQSATNRYFFKLLYYNPNNNDWNNVTRTTVGNIATTSRFGKLTYDITTSNVATSNVTIYDANNFNEEHRFNVSNTRFERISEVNTYWVGYKRNDNLLQFGKLSDMNFPQPLGNINNQQEYLYIDQQSADEDLFVMYTNVNDNLAFETYSFANQNWDSSIPVLQTNSTASNFFVNATMVNSSNAFHLVYRNNSGNTSVKRFEPAPALTKYYVDKDATGNNTGDSWANAMTSLDVALNNSESTTEEIWVAEGTYTVASRANAYTVGIDNLKIYGGFDGTETNISERDIRNHETILSGDVNNNDGAASFIDANRQENNEHIVYVSGNNILLDGLTISGGFANASSGNNSLGAGIFIEESVVDFTLKNSNLKDNVNFSGGTLYYWPINTSTVIIENCKFTNNTARYAASMYLVTANNVNLTVNLYNNLFNHNKVRNRTSSALGATGDVWLRAYRNNSTVTSTIVNSTFSNFTSFGSNNNPVQSALVLSESDGVHTATVANSILFNNMSTTQLYDISGRSTNILASSITVLNSIGQEDFSLITNKTNTKSDDPMFVDAANYNYQLSAGSPAIDAGNNSQVPASVSVDLAFNQRIFNTTVDMGAYEFGSSPLSTEKVLSETNFKVYPNPFENELNIKSDSSIKIVKISNSLGQFIKKTTSNKINTSFLNRGIYFIEISFENGKIARKKLIKK
ncbi:T9SS type A sorting domain-containing protein [Polaribacter sp. R77954]|uniref:T9SS type A sorting domain-containing protein n=1 Tax=Polaribacter sp. R77954 TaxID=3093870 RepID=UPI0037C62D3A